LRSHDIVAGPAMDGGYYLIGMKQFHQELFTGMDWGTHRVWDQTRSIVHRNGWSLMELDRLRDMDRPEDIAALPKESPLHPLLDTKPLTSVVIPTLNEAATLGKLLSRISGLKTVEAIVSDAGSGDRTREIAEEFSAAVLKVAGGRAAQLNAGAAAAKGEQLLFLHADTVPPEGFADLISKALDNPSTVAGAFRFRTDSPKFSMRLIEASANLRSALGQWPYGDQGLFMEKRIFNEEGGFTPQPFMEDFEFVRRLRRRGRIVTLKEPALTSARRWERLGILRTTLLNQMIISGFLLKVPVAKLERMYRTAGNRA
ncbi:MAG: TIGR04283 family arsenosugar biosynthesis glycosyltransferase, partial [Acidobacteriota bacterium]